MAHSKYALLIQSGGLYSSNSLTKQDEDKEVYFAELVDQATDSPDHNRGCTWNNSCRSQDEDEFEAPTPSP